MKHRHDFRRLQLEQATSFAAEGEFVSPAKLSDADKRKLLVDIEQKKVLSLRFRAKVYADKPNANLFRIHPQKLEEVVARVGTGVVPEQLELNHGWSTYARVGNLDAARIEADEDGVRWMVVEATITDPQAMADFVRGKLDRFSIGLGPWRSIECSLCGKPFERDRWGYLDMTCKHELGVDGCEAWLDADIEETSFVLHPAVDGTHVLSRQGDSQMPQAKKGDEPITEAAAAPVTVEASKTAELDAQKARTLELESRLAALEEEKKAADTERLRLAEQVREHALDSWVREGRIFPAELNHYREYWNVMGEAKCAELVSKRVNNVLGHVSQVVAESKPGAVQTDACSKLARVKQAFKFGLISRDMTEEDIKRLGY